MNRAQPSGFTLIEVLMVIVLASIIAVVSIPQFIDFQKDAKIAVTKDKLLTIRQAILGNAKTYQTGYISHLGAVPANLTDLTTKGSKANYDPISKLGWNGPYIDSSASDWNKDAWGTNLVYNANARTITSCGPNLSCGDSDDISVSF